MSDIRQRLANTELVERILPRFLKYVQVWTTSDRHVAETPSTANQWELAKALEAELRAIGLSDVALTDHCYVLGRLPATAGYENAPAIGFMAHVDTASDVTGKDVKPIVTAGYACRPIPLAEGRVLDPAEFPELLGREGDTIISSDGTTLLGADDKAGIAEILAAVEHLVEHPEIPHGPIEVILTPDEETGKGLPEFPRDWLKASACYTIDGGPVGELEAECFTAYKVEVNFSGAVIHIGAARGKLANAVAMASHFVCMLPRSESPESTDGYYGYYCPLEIKGELEKASVEIFLRDFDMAGMERRIAAMETFARTTEAQFPGGKVDVKPTLQYYNMKRKLDQSPRVLDLLMEAAKATGTDPYFKPIRGGTDGARLTEMGIPTPNVFTGGHSYHSRYEWAGLAEMVAATETIIELIRLWAKERP